MTEEEMEKRLHKSLEQENVSQLTFPFILERSEDSSSISPYLVFGVETDSKAFYQKDFLTYKIEQTQD